MTSTGHSEEFIAAALETVTQCARKAERCPENYTRGITSDALASLAARGEIKVEISGYNWRTVTILNGPFAGSRTMPDPRNGRIFKIINQNGTRMIRRPPLPRRALRRSRLLTKFRCSKRFAARAIGIMRAAPDPEIGAARTKRQQGVKSWFCKE